MDNIRELQNVIDEMNRDYDRVAMENPTMYSFPKPIYLHITSQGGDLFAGLLAFDAIRNSKIPIYTVADAYVVSSGSIMFMAGHKRFMNPRSYMLIHQLSEYREEDMTHAQIMDSVANNVELMNRTYDVYLRNYVHAYAPVPAENVLTREVLERHMSHDIFWNFETCFKYGLADGLYTNYNEREEIDRREFYQRIRESKVDLPTYSVITRQMDDAQGLVFAGRDNTMQMTDEMKERVTSAIRKSADEQRSVRDSINSTALGALLNHGHQNVSNEVDDSDKSEGSDGRSDDSGPTFSPDALALLSQLGGNAIVTNDEGDVDMDDDDVQPITTRRRSARTAAIDARKKISDEKDNHFC